MAKKAPLRKRTAKVAVKARPPRTTQGATAAKKKAKSTKAPARKVAMSVASQLAMYYHRNGYVRRQLTDRLDDEGYRKYKKGDEIRLTAESRRELQTIRRLLREAGFNCGSAFAHANQWRQPVYGRDEVTRFLALVGATDS